MLLASVRHVADTVAWHDLTRNNVAAVVRSADVQVLAAGVVTADDRLLSTLWNLTGTELPD